MRWMMYRWWCEAWGDRAWWVFESVFLRLLDQVVWACLGDLPQDMPRRPDIWVSLCNSMLKLRGISRVRLLVYKKVYLLKDGYFYILLCDYICVAIIITRDYFFKGVNAGGSNTKWGCRRTSIDILHTSMEVRTSKEGPFVNLRSAPTCLYGKNVVQTSEKVLYLKNKCGPINYGPHCPRYIEQKMWSRRHKNSVPYSKGLPHLTTDTRGRTAHWFPLIW